MELICHGAVRTTTGSRHLLRVNGQNILLDCGLREGRRSEAAEQNAVFPFPPESLDAVVLSHAHIDHSGNLPNLVRQGYKGNIYSTFATRDLCAIMLQDSAKVQASDAVFVNKKRAKQELPPIEPLYDTHDVDRAMEQFVAINYHRPFLVAQGVTVTFLDAGHMLGSAQVLVEIEENGVNRRLLFSGDLGRGHNDILRDPEIPQNIDHLLLESTYGGKEHEDLASANDELCRIVRETLARNGKLIIPSFAVGRVQQVVFALHQLREANCFPQLPIYVDSPLAVNATEVFRLHPECFNQSTYDFLHSRRNPFGWEDITYIREVAQSMHLNELHVPMIIISSSGMCEAGRILHHLRNNIGDDRNTVLFIGYCAENTLGAKLRRGEKEVNIFGEPFSVRAKIEKVDAYSGHADHSELMQYVRAINGPKHKIILVHGELERSEALQRALQAEKLGSEVIVPELGQPILL
jgi:metallo-beta-lactamase family protein